jgi:hypothetical protein
MIPKTSAAWQVNVLAEEKRHAGQGCPVHSAIMAEPGDSPTEKLPPSGAQWQCPLDMISISRFFASDRPGAVIAGWARATYRWASGDPAAEPSRARGFRSGQEVSMRIVLWGAFFLICNIIGVETFKATVTLPSSEALVPGVLTICLVGLAALSASRLGLALKAVRSSR